MRTALKFIIPDWDDIVDPGYDFVHEVSSPEYRQDRFQYGARIWDFYDPSPVDGVLISISTITENRAKLARIESVGARRFLRLKNNMQLIGDCGAWQYKDLDKPPYKVEEVLDYYNRLGVDYGISLDHIPFFGNPKERMELTYNNALASYDLWKPRYERGDYGFVLMGSVQGLTIEDYVDMFNKLCIKGYRHFAIGGLARRDSEFIKKLVGELVKVARSHHDVEKIHFLGIARASVIPHLTELKEHVNEISFDNTTFLRMAWTRTKGNYILEDGRVYTAIRLRKGDQDLYELLRKFDEGVVDLHVVAERLKLTLEERGELEYMPYYLATLKDRPWKICGCEICRRNGIEVLIFRGNNRNRRRGFHNVHVFSKLLKSGRLKDTSFRIVKLKTVTWKIIESNIARRLADLIEGSRKILVITHCTAQKSVDSALIAKIASEVGVRVPSFDLEYEELYRRVFSRYVRPAVEMYRGTFLHIKNVIETLNKCRDVDLYIISARYGVLESRDRIVPYDATLKGMKQAELDRWSKERGVNEKLFRVYSSGGYDLVIAVLPKEYAYAVREFLTKVSGSGRLLLIGPRSIARFLPGNGPILPSGSLPARLKYIKILRNAASKVCSKRVNASLLEWSVLRKGSSTTDTSPS